MLTLRNLSIIAITWHLLLGTYFIYRLRILTKGFKKSEYKYFLDFYEVEYLQKEEKTWRRKWSWVYNSKLYTFGHILVTIVSYAIAIAVVVGLWIVMDKGYGGLLGVPL